MSDFCPGSVFRCVLVLWVALLLAPHSGLARASEARAASSASGQPQPPADADFLFGRPRTVLGVAGGWLAGTESGDLFEFVRDELTIDEGDFDTATVRFTIGRALGPRLDALAEVGVSQARVQSEYRDFVEGDDLPITQTSELLRVPVQGTLRAWLVPRGREIGRFVWVPRRVAPYVGAGGGGHWYRFTQFGDFVDFVDLGIFSDRFETGGWAWTGHVFGGVSIRVARQTFLNVEARQTWAQTPTSGDFVGFDTIGLGGLRLSGGLEFVF